MPASTPQFKDEIAPFARASLPLSILDLLTSVVPYIALMALQIVMLNHGAPYWQVLLLVPLTAGFLLRSYIVFHDCTHGSFMPTKRGNHIVGAIVGVMVFTPFQTWRHSHAVHHATAGDLDRRGTGDVPTMTVHEYLDAPPAVRAGYRTFRNPLVMFGLGWLWGLVIQPRIVGSEARPRLKRSTWVTNVVLVLVVTAMCITLGWDDFLLAQAPAAALAGAAGVFLFYVQHQFEDTYWESGESWTYADAALRGSSYLKLPQPFQWFTGNIGLHHVHHLSAKVPNYRLQAAHDALPVFKDVPVLTFRDGVKASRLKVWSPEERRLLTWSEVRALRRNPVPAPAAS